MQCSSCKERKLSEEFPEMISERCEHAPEWCLQCVQENFRPHEPSCYCGARVQILEFQRLKNRLLFLHCPVPAELARRRDIAEKSPAPEASAAGSITVKILDGRSYEVSVVSGSTLKQLAESIQKQSGVVPGCQLLFHHDRRLDVTADGFQTLVAMKIPFGSVLNLVVLMHAESRLGSGNVVSGDSLSFLMAWKASQIGGKVTDSGNPKIYQLQGTCTALNKGGEEIDIVGTQNISAFNSAIVHSGDSSFRNPSQNIFVDLLCLPSEVYYLFFTLSCRYGLEQIIAPSVTLRDATQKKLASYSPETALLSRPYAAEGGAIVLCCAKKSESIGSWIIVECGTASDGYLHFQYKQADQARYAPIAENIETVLGSHVRLC